MNEALAASAGERPAELPQKRPAREASALRWLHADGQGSDAWRSPVSRRDRLSADVWIPRPHGVRWYRIHRAGPCNPAGPRSRHERVLARFRESAGRRNVPNGTPRLRLAGYTAPRPACPSGRVVRRPVPPSSDACDAEPATLLDWADRALRIEARAEKLPPECNARLRRVQLLGSNSNHRSLRSAAGSGQPPICIASDGPRARRNDSVPGGGHRFRSTPRSAPRTLPSFTRSVSIRTNVPCLAEVAESARATAGARCQRGSYRTGCRPVAAVRAP